MRYCRQGPGPGHGKTGPAGVGGGLGLGPDAANTDPTTNAAKTAQPIGEILLNTMSSLIAGLCTLAALVSLCLAGQWRRQPYLTGYLALSAPVALGSLAWPILGGPVAFAAIDCWQGLMLVLCALQAGRDGLIARAWAATSRKALLLVAFVGVLGLMLMRLPMPVDGHWQLRGLVAVDLAVAAVIAEVFHGLYLYGLRPEPVPAEALAGLAIVYVIQAAALLFAESSVMLGWRVAWFGSALYVLTMIGICSACRERGGVR